MLATGVPFDVFAREIGIAPKDLSWLAARKGRKLEAEPTVLWEKLMGLLNRKLGEIMALRIEIEKQEAKVRNLKVLARAKKGKRKYART